MNTAKESRALLSTLSIEGANLGDASRSPDRALADKEAFHDTYLPLDDGGLPRHDLPVRRALPGGLARNAGFEKAPRRRIVPNRPEGLPIPRVHVTLRGVRLPGSRRLACAAMLVAAMVACLAVLLCSQRLEAGSQATTVLPVAHPPGASHADDGSNGHPAKAGYLAAPAEEAEAGEEHPVDAERLTALLFVVFMGTALGLLGGKRLLQRSLLMQPNWRRFLPSFGRPSPQGPTAPLLSVFRL